MAALTAACAAIALLAAVSDPLPTPEPTRVALVAPRASRLAQQLRRELQASGFQVEPLAAATAPALEAVGASRAVVVDPGGDRVHLLSRSGPALVATDDLIVNARDDLASRRVALAVVEQLRRPPGPRLWLRHGVPRHRRLDHRGRGAAVQRFRPALRLEDRREEGAVHPLQRLSHPLA
jgi:hypothetical protein